MSTYFQDCFDCSIANESKIISEKKDHNGLEVIFLYEIDPPLCFQDSRGHIVGVVPEIFSTAAKSLNLTIKYKPADPPNIWGSK